MSIFLTSYGLTPLEIALIPFKLYGAIYLIITIVAYSIIRIIALIVILIKSFKTKKQNKEKKYINPEDYPKFENDIGI